MSESKTKEQTNKTKDKCDFTDLLIKEEAKNQIESSSWTKVKIKDVKLYNGYKYARKDSYYDSMYGYSSIYTNETNPENAIRNRKGIDSEEFSMSSYNLSMSSCDRIDDSILYKSSDLITLKISDLDEQYNTTIPIKPRTDVSKEETAKKLENKEYIYIRKPYMNDVFSDFELKIDVNSTDTIPTYMQKIRNTIIKNGLFFLPLFALFTISLYIGIYNVNILVLLSICGSAASIGCASHKIVHKKLSSGVFNSVDYIDDVCDIPDSAEVSNIDNDPNIHYTSANVNVYSDGSVTVVSDKAEWEFKGDNGVPKEKSKELFRKCGGKFDNSEIQIKCYKNTSDIDLGDNAYHSDDHDWVFEHIYL